MFSLPHTAALSGSVEAKKVQPRLRINQPGDRYEQEADAMANQVMRSRSPLQQNRLSVTSTIGPSLQRKCAHCEEEEKKRTLMRKENGAAGNGTMTADFSNGLFDGKSAGSPLPTNAKFEMESAFSTDFSLVRIHTNSAAARLSDEINAIAFTVGNDIYFNQGKFEPDTFGGKHLLAHELTHVVQQGESEIPRVQRLSCPEATAPGRTAQSAGRNNIDARAQRIIDRAGDDSITIADRAVRSFNDIVCAYFPEKAGLIRNVTYRASEQGLHTTSVGRGASARGDIEVGNYFISNVTTAYFARRVLQVGHELQHVQQYREGIVGSNRSDEREFLAFHTEALADEFEGTGRMSRSTRLNLIDGALGYYFCLSSDLQTANATNRQELLTRRQQLIATGRISNPRDLPDACARS